MIIVSIGRAVLVCVFYLIPIDFLNCLYWNFSGIRVFMSRTFRWLLTKMLNWAIFFWISFRFLFIYICELLLDRGFASLINLRFLVTFFCFCSSEDYVRLRLYSLILLFKAYGVNKLLRSFYLRCFSWHCIIGKLHKLSIFIFREPS